MTPSSIELMQWDKLLITTTQQLAVRSDHAVVREGSNISTRDDTQQHYDSLNVKSVVIWAPSNDSPHVLWS
jgi:hypothetical protein